MLFIRTEGNTAVTRFDCNNVILWLYDAVDGTGPRVYAKDAQDAQRMGQRLATLANLENQFGQHYGGMLVDSVTAEIYLDGARAITGRGKPCIPFKTGVNHRISVAHSGNVLETVIVSYWEPGTAFDDAAERTLVPGMDMNDEIDEAITEDAPHTTMPSHGQDRQQIPPIGAVSPRQPWQPRFVPAPRKFYLVRNLLRAGFVLAILAPMGQDLPTITLPSVTLPEITLPRFALPAVHLPQITLPQLSLPSVALPALPTIDLEPTPARVDGPWTIHRDGTLEFVHGGAIWSGDFFVEEDVIYQMNNRPLPVACLTYHGWIPICPEIVRYAQTPALP